MKSKIAAFFGVNLIFTAVAIAAPNEEGQIINLTYGTDGAVCPIKDAAGYGESTLYHLKVNDDATLSEFSVPQGYSFVITHIDNGSFSVESSTTNAHLVSGSGVVSDVVVKSGMKICGNGGNIHGHLEKIK